MIGLGLLGLVLPIMPGWLLIVAGLSLWATEFVWAGRVVEGARRRLHRLGQTAPKQSQHDDRAA